jgi:hypothetical protein
MKSIIFWDMTPCSPLSFNRRFGGAYRLHLQSRRNRFSKPPACLLVCWTYSKIRLSCTCLPPASNWPVCCTVHTVTATGLWGGGGTPVASEDKMFEFTGMARCCSTGLSSCWLMCLHRDSTWHPVTGHLNWPANWHRVNGPLRIYDPNHKSQYRACYWVFCSFSPFELPPFIPSLCFYLSLLPLIFSWLSFLLFSF